MLQVPADCIGLVIGKSGGTIKEVREEEEERGGEWRGEKDEEKVVVIVR